ncbi:MAG: M23 family metallopeptidase [Tannerella sp.]|nr:M23 family metallopeptidase [Tannerella sp.]
MDIPILLSGNFGELRSNHFHAGLDFKTQSVEGKAIYAIEDGYVSRIFVSAWGYGNAIYISHSDTIMSVYGHLQRFTPEISSYVKAKQYEQESFEVDLLLTAADFPVKKGDIIGYSGNAGSSGGPHLHFEIRDMLTDEIIDPLPYYSERIKDTRPPQIRALMVYPVEDEGVVNGSQQKRKFLPASSKTSQQTFTDKIEAWGKIAFSINIDDYMDGTTNVYGVKEIVMFVDGEQVFRSYLDRFAFDESRYLNTYVDFEEWKEKKSLYNKTFVDPGNRLRFITSKNRGFITVDEERTYQINFRLTDAYGNTNIVTANVTGKKQTVKKSDISDATPFFWNGENNFGASGVRLYIPRGSLYQQLYFRHLVWPDSLYLSDIHTLHNKPVALHLPAQLSLRILADTIEAKRQYGIVSIVNKRNTWIGGTYRDGWIDADIRELGVYAIKADSVPPKITPVGQQMWTKNGVISFRMTDNLSGIATYRGEIDGQFALFEFDGKKALITYKLDKERVSPGNHSLSFTVTDACGNQNAYQTTIRH